MFALRKLVKRIWTDFVEGRNVEAYFVTGIAFVIAVLGVFGDTIDIRVQLAAILAALGVLVFRTTVPEETDIDLDAVLKDRQGYRPFQEFLEGADTVLIYGPSAVNILRQIDLIERKILQRGGTVRILLQDASEKGAMDILHRQLDKIHDLDNDIQSSLRTLERVKATLKRGTLEYRVLPYSPGFSIILIDPDGIGGRLTVEFFGYENERIHERMHIEISRTQSAYWFEYWQKQYELMWNSAREV